MVLDASAVLAFLHAEPGADRVRQALDGALISTVNWTEVLQISLRRNADVGGMQQEFAEVGLSIEQFTTAQAALAAELWPKTRARGLSLGDRACLALAIDRNAAVLTADQAWTELALDLDIQQLR